MPCRIESSCAVCVYWIDVLVSNVLFHVHTPFPHFQKRYSRVRVAQCEVPILDRPSPFMRATYGTGGQSAGQLRLSDGSFRGTTGVQKCRQLPHSSKLGIDSIGTPSPAASPSCLITISGLTRLSRFLRLFSGLSSCLQSADVSLYHLCRGRARARPASKTGVRAGCCRYLSFHSCSISLHSVRHARSRRVYA